MQKGAQVQAAITLHALLLKHQSLLGLWSCRAAVTFRYKDEFLYALWLHNYMLAVSLAALLIIYLNQGVPRIVTIHALPVLYQVTFISAYKTFSCTLFLKLICDGSSFVLLRSNEIFYRYVTGTFDSTVYLVCWLSFMLRTTHALDFLSKGKCLAIRLLLGEIWNKLLLEEICVLIFWRATRTLELMILN